MGQLDERIAASGAEPYLVQRSIVRETTGPPGYPGREVRVAVGIVGIGTEGIPLDELRDELVNAAMPAPRAVLDERTEYNWGAAAPIVQTLVVDVGAGILGSAIWTALVAIAQRIRRSRARPDREITAELIFEQWAWFVERAFDASHVRARSIEQTANGNWWVDGYCDGLPVEAKFSPDGRIVIARYKRDGTSELPDID